jgi:hypothetical protein
MIRYAAFIRYCKKDGSAVGHCISFFRDFNEAYESVRTEVLQAIPIQMCLNSTCNNVLAVKI